MGGARRAARRPRALGPPAGVPLRLRRADAGPARRGRHARAARRGRGLRRAALRARAPRARRQRRDRAGARAGAEVVELPERADHYAGVARPALHHLERGLFEAGGEQRAPNGAVRLLEAGGERAEAELVGAEVLELMRDGVAPEEIAVLVRGDAGAALFAQVLGTYGIPVGYARRVPLGRTRLGSGLLAGVRAALPGGRAGDLLVWLRTPGMPGAPRRGRRARRAACGASEIAGAREAASRWAPDALARLDALADAAGEGPEALLAALVARGGRALGGPARAPRPPARPRRARRGARRRRAAGGGGRAARARGQRSGAAGRSRGRARDAGGGRGAPGRRDRGRAARRPARDPRAALPRRLRVRAAGRASSRGGRCPSRSSTTTRGAGSPPPRGCGCRCTRTCSTASARCSTPASRARRRCCSCPGARPTRRASRWSPRRSSTTCARCSPTSCGPSAGGGCSPR